MNILDKARLALQHAQAEARKTAAAHRSALAKLREAENRVRRLEFAVIEYETAVEAARRRGEGRAT